MRLKPSTGSTARRRSGSWLAAVLTLFVATITLVAAAQDKPEVTHTLFDNLPAKVIYFEDTSVRAFPLSSLSSDG